MREKHRENQKEIYREKEIERGGGGQKRRERKMGGGGQGAGANALNV